MLWQRPGRLGSIASAMVAASIVFGSSSRVVAAGANSTADLQDGTCITVLALDAAKAKPEQRPMFEAGAFYFFGRITGRHSRADLVKVIKAGAAQSESPAERKRCYGEIRAIEGLLEKTATVFQHE